VPTCLDIPHSASLLTSRTPRPTHPGLNFLDGRPRARHLARPAHFELRLTSSDIGLAEWAVILGRLTESAGEAHVWHRPRGLSCGDAGIACGIVVPVLRMQSEGETFESIAQPITAEEP